MSVRGEERSRKRYAVRDDETVNIQKNTMRAFDGRTMYGLKFTLCKRSLNFMFDRRPTGRHLHNLKQKRESGFAKGYGE